MAKLRLILALSVTLILFGFSFSSATESSNDINQWVAVDIPAQGQAGGWFLAHDSDILHLALVDDGVLYAAVSDTVNRVYRSNDGGFS